MGSTTKSPEEKRKNNESLPPVPLRGEQRSETSKMRVYFVRHAQSVGNSRRMYFNFTDPLTRTGIEQAEKVAERFKDIQIDVIVCSRHERAMHTARIIGKALNKKIRITSLFNEQKTPTEWHGQPTQGNVVSETLLEQEKHMGEPKWHYSDEENKFDLEKRARRAMRYLEDLGKKNVLVVSHSGMIRMFFIAVAFFDKGLRIRKDPALFYETASRISYLLPVSNTGITIFNYDGKWKLDTWNDRSHVDQGLGVVAYFSTRKLRH